MQPGMFLLRWLAMAERHGGLVKPAITFFGEALPSRFSELLRTDFPRCKCLLIFGTSLQVQPFASLVGRVKPTVPRLLINREAVGAPDPMAHRMQPRCSRDAAEMQPRCSRDAALAIFAEQFPGPKGAAELSGSQPGS